MNHAHQFGRSTTTTESPTGLSEAVVEAVASAEGCDPVDLPVLYERIDPDALDKLFDTPGRSDGRSSRPAHVRFTYHGYEVHAHADGRVSVEPL